MSINWYFVALVMAAAGGVGLVTTQLTGQPAKNSTDDEPKAGEGNEVEYVENLITARKSYLDTLNQLRKHYISTNDIEKTRWVEEEIRSFHRMMKYSYRLDVRDVPPPTLVPKKNIPEANNLFRQAMDYKGKGTGWEYLDNQRRAEILLQAILERYNESDKIADVAYHLGEIYEKYTPYPQLLRAAAYYERSFEWNPASTTDARYRAAIIYDTQLKMTEQAKKMYKEVLNHDTNPQRVTAAEKRLYELSSFRR